MVNWIKQKSNPDGIARYYVKLEEIEEEIPTMIKTKACPHVELILEYAKDCQESDQPWILWQYWNTFKEEWVSFGVLHGHPLWNSDTKYRRKPEPVKTININCLEVPEPLRGASEKRN